MTRPLASDATILTEIEAFLEAHDMPLTTFGRRAVGDPNLIPGLRAGRELRRSTEQRVRAFMEAHDASVAA